MMDVTLDRLALVDAEKAKLVKLRYFAGLTMSETADAMGVSLATAERYWSFARSWLYAELKDGAAANRGAASPIVEKTAQGSSLKSEDTPCPES